jgi:hypothetical protein
MSILCNCGMLNHQSKFPKNSCAILDGGMWVVELAIESWRFEQQGFPDPYLYQRGATICVFV